MTELTVQPHRRMTSYDTTWKDALEAYFPAFMDLLFPEAFAGIDWARGYTFRDKELQKLDPRGSKGPRTVDKLVEVHRSDGDRCLVYVHVEVQSQPQVEFARRMYVYHYRLFDKYEGEVVSLAVLADDSSGWKPEAFEYALWGCRLRLEFPTVKLVDFHGQWDELVASENPFAVVVQSHLKALRTRGKPARRKEWKLAIIRRLYDRNVSRDEIRKLFRFIDGLMTLPKDLDDEFVFELGNMEEEKNMPYVSSVERVGLRRGRKEGREEGRKEGELLMARESVIVALEARFGDVHDAVKSSIESINSIPALRSLHREAVLVASVEVFEAKMGEIAPG